MYLESTDFPSKYRRCPLKIGWLPVYSHLHGGLTVMYTPVIYHTGYKYFILTTQNTCKAIKLSGSAIYQNKKNFLNTKFWSL